MFNILQMVHFLNERFSSYYEKRLIDFSNNRPQRIISEFPSYSGQEITALSSDVYEVVSSKYDGSVYVVNVAAALCSCHEGQSSRPCKHLHYVNVQRNHDGSGNSYQTQDCKELMYVVACGHKPPGVSLDNERLLPGASDDEVTDVEDIVSDEISEFQAEFNLLWKKKVVDRAKLNPAEYVDAYRAILETLRNLKTSSATISAMHTFGKL